MKRVTFPRATEAYIYIVKDRPIDFALRQVRLLRGHCGGGGINANIMPTKPKKKSNCKIPTEKSARFFGVCILYLVNRPFEGVQCELLRKVALKL